MGAFRDGERTSLPDLPVFDFHRIRVGRLHLHLHLGHEGARAGPLWEETPPGGLTASGGKRDTVEDSVRPAQGAFFLRSQAVLPCGPPRGGQVAPAPLHERARRSGIFILVFRSGISRKSATVARTSLVLILSLEATL